jgi:hypothetical protein
MFKEARKPSTDPAQEKLRQEKADWNKSVSALINALINFKKLMNGQPSKFFMQKSMIKNPIPSNPATIIADLADDFQFVAQKAKDIAEHQLVYSKTRKKKQPKLAPEKASETISTPSADLTQQLTSGLTASLETQLTVEASNPLTRLLSKFRGPWLGDKGEVRKNKYRKSLLKSAHELDKELSRLESEIVGSGAESIFIAGRRLKKIVERISFLAGSVGSFHAGEPKKEPLDESPENQVMVDEKKIILAEEAINDFRRYKSNFTDLDPKLTNQLHSLMINFLAASVSEKGKLASQVIQVYQALIADINGKNGTSASNLKDILIAIEDRMSKEAPMQMAAMEQKYQLQAQGQNPITKWLGKVKHKLSPFDKTSALRLDIYKLAGDARAVANQMMNGLEKDVDLEQLQSFITELGEKIIAMQKLMVPLEATIRGKMFDKSFMELLKSKNILDHDYELDEKGQQRLQQMLQGKHLRELIR